MDNMHFEELKSHAAKLASGKYIESGYVALRHEDGILLTTQHANLASLSEDEVVFVNDKNIESYEGNFRAAAVILFCAIRQDKHAEAAAIVDSDAILAYSSKRRALMPTLDELAQHLGASVKSASKNVAAEIVASLSSIRHACFMPDAGAVVRARSLDALLQAVEVLDKAANAEIVSESKNGTKHLSAVDALAEYYLHLLKKDKKAPQPKQDEKSTQETVKGETPQSAEEVKEVADEVKDGGEPAEQPTESEEPAEQTDESTAPQSDSAEEPQQTDEVREVREDQEPTGVIELKMGEGQTGVYAFARPYYASAIAAMGTALPVADDLKATLGDAVPVAPSARVGSGKATKNILAAMGSGNCCILANHGVVAHADDLAKASEILSAIEAAAKAYLA